MVCAACYHAGTGICCYAFILKTVVFVHSYFIFSFNLILINGMVDETPACSSLICLLTRVILKGLTLQTVVFDICGYIMLCFMFV